MDLESRQITAVVITTIGATPTVTVQLQGSHDSTNWVGTVFVDDSDTTQTKLLSLVITAAVTKGLVKVNNGYYRFWRLSFFSNTNVTITYASIGGDSTS